METKQAFQDFSAMRAAKTPRIWLHPPGYWAATEGMSPDEAEGFMNHLLTLAEKRELSALRKYDFISIEDVEGESEIAA